MSVDTNVGVGLFGRETSDERELKAIVRRARAELGEKQAALQRAIEENEVMHEKISRANETLATAEEREAEMEQLRRQLEENKLTLSKNLDESVPFQTAMQQISELNKLVEELNSKADEFARKYESAELKLQKKDSDIISLQASKKELETFLNVEKQKTVIANQTLHNAAKIFDTTVKSLQEANTKQREALNVRDQRTYQSNRILQAAASKAARLISVPPSEGLYNATNPEGRMLPLPDLAAEEVTVD